MIHHHLANVRVGQILHRIDPHHQGGNFEGLITQQGSNDQVDIFGRHQGFISLNVDDDLAVPGFRHFGHYERFRHAPVLR